MVVHNTYRRKTRVIEEVEDLNAYRPANENEPRVPAEELPILYVARIEVKVILIGWITIWSKSCDLSDGDTRAAIRDEALEIQRTILGVS